MLVGSNRLFFLDQSLLKKVSYHPVHIIEGNIGLSPSAFIPFCSFGDDMLLTGSVVDGFSIPVCNIFQAKVWNNQLCYEVDLQKLKDKHNLEDQLKKGLILLLDYNEELQLNGVTINDKVNRKKLKNSYFFEEQDDSVNIHLNTISK